MRVKLVLQQVLTLRQRMLLKSPMLTRIWHVWRASCYTLRPSGPNRLACQSVRFINPKPK